MKVRRLTSGDAADWHDIRLEALKAFPEAFLTTHAEAEAVPLERTARWLDHGHTFGVFVDEALVGTGSTARQNKAMTRHRGTVGPFFVQPHMQGKGVADALLTQMVSAALEAGMWQLELYVAASNDRAIRFYTRHGFAERGRIPNATLSEGVAETDLLMIRSDR